MYYAETQEMMMKQHIVTIIVWLGAANMIDQWLILIDVILSPKDHHSSI